MAAGYAYLAAHVVVLAIVSFYMKVALKDFDAYQLNLLMGIGAVVVTLPVMLFMGRTLVPKMTFSAINVGLVVGIGIGIGSLLYLLALAQLPLGLSLVVSHTYIPLVAILSVVFLQERLSWVQVVGVILALSGVALLVGSGIK